LIFGCEVQISEFWGGVKGELMDKGTEKIVRAIYDDIKKQQADLDWFWVKQEAESIMCGQSPSGTIGVCILDELKKAGKVK